MQYKKLLMNSLLDKYEKSRSYSGQTTGHRRILLKLLQGDFPEYDLERPEIRETINSVIQELTAKELVEYSWLKHEEGNIIEKVWLRLDSLPKAYVEIGRTPKGDIVDKILEMIRGAQSEITSDWIRQYLNDLHSGIEMKRSAMPYLPDDAEYVKNLLAALNAIDKIGQEECLERVFSQKYLGDSKLFKKTVKANFYHWSDIDLGGFHLFVRLRDNIIPEIRPYLMDETAFTAVKHMGMHFDEKYASLLKKSLEKPEYGIFHPVIRMMLQDEIRIEQEAFLL